MSEKEFRTWKVKKLIWQRKKRLQQKKNRELRAQLLSFESDKCEEALERAKISDLIYCIKMIKFMKRKVEDCIKLLTEKTETTSMVVEAAAAETKQSMELPDLNDLQPME